MDKQKIKSVPRLTTDNPVDNFQTACGNLKWH